MLVCRVAYGTYLLEDLFAQTPFDVGMLRKHVECECEKRSSLELAMEDKWLRHMEEKWFGTYCISTSYEEIHQLSPELVISGITKINGRC
jgi:hypothetical protein